MKCLDCNNEMEKKWIETFLFYECKNCSINFDKNQQKNK